MLLLAVAMRAAAFVLGVSLITSSVTSQAAAHDHAHDRLPALLAEDALVLCYQADTVDRSSKEILLDRGLDLAEQALALDEDNPKAHFAVFCNLGKILETSGIGVRTVRSIGRARRELDRTLELAPDYVDALLAKAEMLTRLPRWLGGDLTEAERCRVRARALTAGHAGVRLASDAPVVDGEG